MRKETIRPILWMKETQTGSVPPGDTERQTTCPTTAELVSRKTRIQALAVCALNHHAQLIPVP